MFKKNILMILFFGALVLCPLVALNAQSMDMNAGEETMHEMEMGPMIADRMLHAWISALAAIIIFSLALKYMTGGALARPIMLMGLGALMDAMIGLFPSHEGHMETMWIGSLIFSTSVVVGIIWMANIFGVFVKKTKQEKTD